ncbi:hypothetical protein AB7M18_003568 [Pseudomonas viridiflava]
MPSAHRPATLQPNPAPWFAAKSGCDICGKCRSQGNHKACSKQRQAFYAQRAKELKS